VATRPRKKSDIVDGFTTMKAAQRATARKSPAKKKPAKKSTDNCPASGKPAPTARKKSTAKKKVAAAKSESVVAAAPITPKRRIGHTAEPSRHDIVCYECGYGFLLTGKLQTTYCPKCRTELNAQDYKIDASWSKTIKTIGTVEILKSGVVKGGTIAATKVLLSGRIDAGTVTVSDSMEIHGRGSFEREAIDVLDIVIAADAVMVSTRKLTFRNVDVFGSLKARIDVTGTMRIRAGGFLRGDVRGQHLLVDDGAGLDAKIAITAPARAENGTTARRNAA
jgi:cytoskeletal protein CcmA (bactofilin family)